MRRKGWPGLAVLLAALGPTARGAEPSGPLVAVGVARIDVTPTFPVRLSGYLGRTSESNRVDQRLWVKALAIGGDDRAAVVLVSVDNLGVGEAVVEEVAGRLHKAVGLERARFVVASSHTHSAPCLTGVAPNIFGKRLSESEQAHIDRYTRELTDAIERASLDALKARKPGRLSWAQGSVGFAANRRPQGGPVDHALPVLRVTDERGAVRAILVNYACHCTTLKPEDNACSGDWAGHAQEAIEKDHPGAVALTVVGCGADANPTRRLEPGAAADHGQAIADEIKRLSAGPWT
ncbi:MAG: neutral/alkaline non-lysosomal ceramidase N-terminal domain-containing protein, partial [Isosphaeraceae bacterium]